jgi:hypothetical protein
VIDFKPIPGVDYKFLYHEIFADIANGKTDAKQMYRTLVLNDLFFIVHFILGVEEANHPFVVEVCQMVEKGPQSNTLDIWAREHFKTSIITIAETIQYMLRDPDSATGLFSYVRPVAKANLRAIKNVFENNEVLRQSFPDLIWDKPDTQAPKWSEDEGLVLKRKKTGRREATLEAHGLLEGMPTGRHFDRMIFDDALETKDLIETPDQMRKAYEKFGFAQYLGRDGCVRRVIGTFYHHAGPYKTLQALKDDDGNLVYKTRIVPGTRDGTRTGDPILVTKERLNELKTVEGFDSQILCNPTPKGTESINAEMLTAVHRRFIPADVIRFMIIDPAGDRKTQTQSSSKADSWAFGVFGVRPKIDDLGLSEIYLLDGECEPMNHDQAIERIVKMYLRNPWIMRVGVEKTAQSTAEVHIQNALRANNKYISVESGTLQILSPKSKNKTARLEGALAWPVNNGRWHYAADIDPKLIARIKMEISRLGFWHEDFIDAMAYLYDVIKEFRWDRGVKMEPIKYPKRGIY